MIGALALEPWALVERELRLDTLGETESIFALSNGHLGLRGNLDEGEPHAVPGTYLNGFFESIPLPYAERAYGYPEEGQTLIDVTNGKLVRLLVDDAAFDVRYGTLRRHERVLDLRDGVLRREVEWATPARKTVRIRSTRLVSFAHRAIAAVRYEVEPVGAPARIVVQSSLVANEPMPDPPADPRAAAALRSPLIGEYHAHGGLEIGLGHVTRASGMRMSAALDHLVEGPAGTVTAAESDRDLARVTVSTELEPGRALIVVKLAGYGWSSRRSMPALRDQVDAALAAARRDGWEGLLASQRAFLDEFWSRADVELDGDPELQHALRYALFQVIQASARAERTAIPAKGLTGRGYDGHAFWDSEQYALRMLTYTAPDAVRDALLWRHATLAEARRRAQMLGLAGATFPWRTIRGEECSGYWPAGTAAFHVNADVADAVRRYVAATGDAELDCGPGLELLVETARLWCSLGHHDAEGCFRIDGVTGPDEYSALGDNNVFTNLMAARNLVAAADASGRHPDAAAALGVDEDERRAWRRAAGAMVVPFDDELGVTQQAEGFTRYREWDFETTPPGELESTGPRNQPLLLRYPYNLLYSSQVVKQADLVFALYACGDQFEPEQKRRDFEYYERITARDSSLSAAIQGVVAAEVGHRELAHAYLRETAFVDLRNLSGNTVDGVHLAAAAGGWLVAVAGFGGLRDHGDTLAFAPCLPRELTRLAFTLLYRGRRLRVEVEGNRACYALLDGEPLKVLHYGDPVTVRAGEPRELGCPSAPGVKPIEQPPQRAPEQPGAGG